MKSVLLRVAGFFALPCVLFVLWHSPIAVVAQGDPPMLSLQPDQAELVERDVWADDSAEPRVQRRGQRSSGVFKSRISPNWVAGNTHFWYRNDLRGGEREYVLVDAEQGNRERAFDHERLAKSLQEAGVEDARSDRLPLQQLKFDLEANAISFAAGSAQWTCNLETYKLEKLKKEAPVAVEGLRPLSPDNVPRASTQQGPETEITFVNNSRGTIQLFWLNRTGRRQSYGTVAVGRSHAQHTYAGHIWVITDERGFTLAVFRAEEQSERAVVTGRMGNYVRRRRPRSGFRPGTSQASPDGKWTAALKDNNIFVRKADEEAEIQLSKDGQPDNAYRMLQWSPDSKHLLAFRAELGDDHQVHLIQSSPNSGGRAKLSSRSYALPGDKFTAYELNLFDVVEQKQIKPELARIDFGFPRLRWYPDGERVTFVKVDRGHQRYRLMEVNVKTGDVRTLVDEKSDTFVWTAHGPNVAITTALYGSNELVLTSERDGWRHLYLVDAQTEKVKNRITKGKWVVRGIDRIDAEQRQVWFRAGGFYPDQDPYLVHFFRVNLDGSGLVALTEGNGNHSIQFSPDGRYLIDTYSRVDRAPVHELRRADDGRLVCKLETADTSQLEASGWEPPEVFSAKGRDGKTDIWGFICRPRDFDATKKYPIIEDIYAGPHDSHVPKSFSSSRRYSDLTDLGFIVVKIDGMGTANRSKAFHDVCWQNLKDAGLPDRILWIKAAARKYPYMDTRRVGIYGTSAGGQNAAAALLFHPEFYKAAVAACGCHDNRMDKASWNEQWMGYPVGPHYSASSNIDNAGRLEGKLLLIVGEMDTNVPPESTMRFVDALINEGKDFDLLVIPGAGHTSGGSYGRRRLRDFFVRHLQDVEPPDRNAPSPTEETAEESPSNAEPPPLDLTSLPRLTNEIGPIRSRYEADLGSLNRFYSVRESTSRQQRLSRFLNRWTAALDELPAASLEADARSDLAALKVDVRRAMDELQSAAQTDERIEPLLPFAATIIELAEAGRRGDKVNSPLVAERLDRLAGEITQTHVKVKDAWTSGDAESASLAATDVAAAAESTTRLQSYLRRWYGFYHGYDPIFTWWMSNPYQKADKELEAYASFLKRHSAAAQAADAEKDAEANLAEPDVPSLAEMVAGPQGRMRDVIAQYSAARRPLRGGRGGRGRGRSRTRSSQPSAQSGTFYSRWRDGVEQLDFDSMKIDDKIDYLLLRKHLDYQLARAELRGQGREQAAAVTRDSSGIVGYPIGREALLIELAHEMIPYTPEELVAIAEHEYEWCRAELLRASRDMGLGDDWRKAIEKVKTMHVAPGEQPQLITDLAIEAIDYLEEHGLVTVPPLASETWRMQMMSPQRQLVNPFFTGGEVISVSFPTDTMSHQDKLQSLRGNNIPFARATVHHELIPGHHLQMFMNNRYRPYRLQFGTPFWLEGWALYWEMVLYDRGFPKTPEDRVGFLVWRSHRCARIIFSLNFHLGRMTPQECIDFLVANVGFERNNSAAEVRRSVGRSYPPLYQAAYMLGGLQIRELRKELVDTGKMPEREFHDIILRQNRLPIELVRAVLTSQPLTRDYKSNWRFYDAVLKSE